MGFLKKFRPKNAFKISRKEKNILTPNFQI
jgi:hypothetical protein